MKVSKVSKVSKPPSDTRGVKSVTPYGGTLTPDTSSDSAEVSERFDTSKQPLAIFDTAAAIVETELTFDDFLALAGNESWRVVWIERCAIGWRVRAERITRQATSQPELRMPYRDD
jgi:hypothetical protein